MKNNNDVNNDIDDEYKKCEKCKKLKLINKYFIDNSNICRKCNKTDKIDKTDKTDSDDINDDTKIINNFNLIGEIKLNDKDNNEYWKIEWKSNDYKKDYPRIYLICSKNNDILKIKKIGKSEGKGGMKTTFDFYKGGLKGSPSIRTFGIHHLIYNELKNNNKIYIYGMFIEPIQNIKIKGLYTEENKQCFPSANDYEEKCRCDYKNIYDKYPEWNFQENGLTYPENILNLYKEQVNSRENTRRKK
jgi:hypothetical protein